MASLFLRSTDPLRPPETAVTGRGLVFAVIAHAALVAALTAGVSWRTQAPPAFEAELWSATPQAAAPKEVLPPAAEPEPEPIKKAETKPVQQVEEDTLQAERDAEIALAREKKKKQAAELELERKRREALKAKEKLEQEEKRRIEKLEQQAKLDKEKKEKKETKAKQDKAAEAKLDAQRQENLRRIQGMAGASGAPNATGTALKSSGPTASYGGRIKASIRPNIIFTDTPSGNPLAEVEVRVAPDGAIISRKLLKASGDLEWDKAVLRAIDKTEKLPRDVDGRVPPVLVIGFQPLE